RTCQNLHAVRRFGGMRSRLSELLRVPHLPVPPAVAQEGVVRAQADAAAAVEDENAIGVAQGGEAVGDDQAGTPRLQAVDGALHLAFGDGIEAPRRLVEPGEPRVLD